MKEPRVKVNNEEWNKKNGLRIIVHTGHDGFAAGMMFSVDHARLLAKKLIEACDEIEHENNICKDAFLSLGRKLGFIDN